MLTPQKARQDYETAATALEEILLDPSATSAQRQIARDALRDVTQTFIQQVEMEIDALSVQYSEFIISMKSLLDDLQSGTTPLGALKSLTGLVTQGAALINAAKGTGGALPGNVRAFRGTAAAAPRSPTNTLRILCIHGVGHEEGEPD